MAFENVKKKFDRIEACVDENNKIVDYQGKKGNSK